MNNKTYGEIGVDLIDAVEMSGLFAAKEENIIENAVMNPHNFNENRQAIFRILLGADRKCNGKRTAHLQAAWEFFMKIVEMKMPDEERRSNERAMAAIFS